MTAAVLLGVGRLTWPAGERRSDRYGVVSLLADEDVPGLPGVPPGFGGEVYTYVPLAAPTGRGHLVAEVLATRQSHHIGDLFRGIGPETPEVGERIVLTAAPGLAVRHETHGMPGLLVIPEEERASDWLMPRALYRCHDQTVRLLWEPA